MSFVIFMAGVFCGMIIMKLFKVLDKKLTKYYDQQHDYCDMTDKYADELDYMRAKYRERFGKSE